MRHGDRHSRLVLLIPLALLGLAGFAAYTAARWWSARSWPDVPCTILSAEVREGSGEHAYVFKVRYRYAWKGQDYIGEKVREEYRGSHDIAEAERLRRVYPAGALRTCYVNPSAPSGAVLQHEEPWLPLGIAVVAAVGAVATFAVRSAGPRAIEVQSGPFIALMGLACYAMFFVPSLWTWHRSLSWRPVPCVIEAARVRSLYRHSYPAGVTVHWPDVVYRYQVGGMTFRANAVNASDLGSPWPYGYRRLVRRLPPGSSTLCYVNPADPSEAVLGRDLSVNQLYGLWPLFLAAFGTALAYHQVTGREVRLGTPRHWGLTALWAATTVSVYALVTTGSDLVHDHRAGVAEPMEKFLVLILGLASAGLLLGWIALARRHWWETAAAVRPTALRHVWDQQIDERVVIEE